MKRIKKVDLKKLTIDATTIRILSDLEQKQALGGIGTGTATTATNGTTSKIAPDTCA